MTKTKNAITANSLKIDNEQFLLQVLDRTEPLARRISWEVTDSITDPEDAYQEMVIEQIKTIRKIQEQKSLDDLVYICLNALKNYRLYCFRETSRRHKHEGYTTDVNEVEEWTKCDFVDSHVLLHQKELMSSVELSLREKDLKYPGLFEFFANSVEPSAEVWDAALEYKSNSANPKGMADNRSIPPAVLAKILDVSPGRLRTFKNAIARTFMDCGISENQVRKYFDFGQR